MTTDPSEFEQEHVHFVYDNISQHFSDTRYKIWPRVETFLAALPSGSIGIDVGCGNGRNMLANKNICIIGSDRSRRLLDIRQNRGLNVVHADILALPHTENRFDFAISIAVIHHLASEDRRRNALSQIIRILAPGGKALIYVLAWEKDESQRKSNKNSPQDQMIPWKLPISSKKDEVESHLKPRQFDRYYHLFRKGELEDLLATCKDASIIEQGSQRDNWWAVIAKNSSQK